MISFGFHSLKGEVYSLHITKEHIFAGTDEKIVHVWNNDEQMEVLCRLRGHAGTIHSIRSLRIGESERVFSASADRSLRVWSMENKLCAQVKTWMNKINFHFLDS